MIYAWGWTQDYTSDDRVNLPVPLIQYRENYSRARNGDIAYVGNLVDAQAAVKSQVKWRAAILGDEWNLHSSGAEYSAAFADAERVLRNAKIFTIAAGAGMPGGEFDHDFVRGVSICDAQGINVSPIHYEQLRNGMRHYPSKQWFVTLIPIRPNWWPWRYNTILAYLHQQRTSDWTKQARDLSDMSSVADVGVWCFREGKLANGYWQSWHGLIDRNGDLTRQGMEAQQLL